MSRQQTATEAVSGTKKNRSRHIKKTVSMSGRHRRLKETRLLGRLDKISTWSRAKDLERVRRPRSPVHFSPDRSSAMLVEAERREELIRQLDVFLERFSVDEKSRHDCDVFRGLYKQFLTEPATIDWSKMHLVPEDILKDYDALPSCQDPKAVLDKVVVVKLNGGLGTTMGCKGPKSLIPVRDGETFLDFAIKQHTAINQEYGSSVPLYLLDSFRTAEATREALQKIGGDVLQFEQSRCPRLDAETLLPVAQEAGDLPEEGWYPPGHGNVLRSLAASGLLDRLLAEGRSVLFVSNIDNSGACLDPRLAQFVLASRAEYVMEVTPKTEADIKGGTLIEIDGKIMHLEMPQVPEEHIDEFCSLRTFKIFNTNNIWIDLRAVKRRLDAISMEIIVNKKTMSCGRRVIQLETSIGGAIRNFEKAFGVRVGRHRFLPVKRTQDLLALKSNLYAVDAEHVLRLQVPRAPVVSLSAHYNSVHDFDARFLEIPDMRALQKLSVAGDVRFGRGVTLRGDVEIVGDGEVAERVLEGRVVL
uniref:UTP--glucose-1-phosphate uridylyltransferase n=1 Tax=Steinernema glaseri TaxID=37863 RepID=A0A1I8ASS6_9BILA